MNARYRAPHRWDVTPAEARAIQARLARRVETADRLGPLRRVAGIDIGFEEGGRVTRAAVAVLSFPALEPLEEAVAREPTRFPYVPGLLSFREVPAALAALERLAEAPDLLLCDGQGYAHPRRFGLACHLGVVTGIPSIGVAKSRLVGAHAALPEARGRWTPLVDGSERIGAVVRTRAGVRPVYVSTGHRVSLPTAVELTLACTRRFRLPEPARAAHHLASAPPAAGATRARRGRDAAHGRGSAPRRKL